LASNPWSAAKRPTRSNAAAGPLASTGDDGSRPAGCGRCALQGLEPFGIDAHLHQGADLEVAGELGVGDVVGPVAEPAGALVVADQEVGMAAPPAIEERGLVDDVGAALHGVQRQLLRSGEVVRTMDLDDVQRPAHLGEDRPLVSVAERADERGAGVVAGRRSAQAEGDLLLQRRQVRAGKVADQVGRAQHHASVGDVQPRSPPR
jgi:hypothetical protein